MQESNIEILVVEDREDDIIALRDAFKRARVLNPVQNATSGREALDLLLVDRPGRRRPDIVFLDLGLPDISGIEVLQEIRREDELANLPVVVLTVSNSDEDILRSYDLGVKAFIQKPVLPDNLLDVLLGEPSFGLVFKVLDESGSD